MFCADLPPIPGSLDRLDIRFWIEGEYLATYETSVRKAAEDRL